MPSDAYLLNDLIGLHYATPPATILDASWGRGRMWVGCAYQPTTRLDKRALPGVDVVGGWEQFPTLMAPASNEVMLIDPPQQTDGTAGALGGRWGDAYGTADPDLQGHLNITHLYPSMLAAARHALDPERGTLIVKIADQTHAGLAHLQGVDFVTAARADGWYVCHFIPLVGWPRPDDPKWKRRFTLRKRWSYFVVLHPNGRCAADGIQLVRTCAGCGMPFRPRRSDQATHGATCRKRKARNTRVPKA